MEIEEIKKVIESCHLNFLVGSGASSPFFKTLGSIENQLTALASIQDKLDENTYRILDCSLKQEYYSRCIEGNSEIVQGSKAATEVQKNYDELIAALNIILVKRRSNLVTKQINIFTTNMDMFIDWSLEKQRLSFNDGFSGRLKATFGTVNFHNTIRKTSSHYDYQSEVPHFNLFKLHGSVNWRLGNSDIEYDHSLTQLNEISANKLVKSDILENIEDELDNLVAEIKRKKITKSNAHDSFIGSYNKLVMINPTKAKFETTTRDLTFYELLRMYSNHLERENSILFVLGFSFADEHIREITKRVAASNPTLLIVVFAYSKNAFESIKAQLTEYPNIKYIHDPTEKTKYSLSKINELYFTRIAQDVNKDEYR